MSDLPTLSRKAPVYNDTRRCLAALCLPLSLMLATGCGAPITGDDFPELTGAYFGQTPPGAEPELFAPGLITTGLPTRDIAITPDGREIYYCVASPGHAYSAIVVTHLENGRWTRPEVASFSSHPEWSDMEPAISPDGQRFFFLSDRPRSPDTGDSEKNYDIWVMDRRGDRWDPPRNLGEPVNTAAPEYFPSVTEDGTLYFCRADPATRVHSIYRARFVDGAYLEPELLPAEVNIGRNRFNAFVAADESYIIVPAVGIEGGYGGVDYYISFRSPDDAWTGPVNMGDKVNSADMSEWSPYVTRDGRFLFFMSARRPGRDETAPRDYGEMLRLQDRPRNGNADIYWMDAGIIEELRATALARTEEDDGHE